MTRPPSAARATVPYRELARLSADTCARIEAGDEEFLEEAIVRRTALLAAITRTVVPADEAPEVMAAIGDVLALDEQLMTLLESHREQVRRELAQISERRAALQSYRGAAPTAALYVERLT